MNKNRKRQIVASAFVAAILLLPAGKKEAQNQIYAEQLARLDGTTELNGQTFCTDSLKGKMVVINFWASYDPTSRINTYQLLQINNEFKNSQFLNANGMEVVSVSLDKYKAPLRKAIENDGTADFHHICDYKGTDSDLAKLFEVYRPVNLLLDANGTVIARDFNVGIIRSTLSNLETKQYTSISQ